MGAKLRRRELSCALCVLGVVVVLIILEVSGGCCSGPPVDEPLALQSGAGADVPVPSQCDEMSWPSVGASCEDCKVVVIGFGSKWDGQCFNYCGSLGMACVGAWSTGLDRTCEADVLHQQPQRTAATHTGRRACGCGCTC